MYFQVVAFLASSILLLLVTRPLVIKYTKVGTVKTNVDSLIGKRGLVTVEISEHVIGQVKLAGQVWSAKGVDTSVYPVGTEVEVTAIEGVKLVVKK